MKRVLITNRDKLDAHGMQWLLNSSYPEWNVTTAFSIDEAVTAIEQNGTDLLILDLDMLKNNSEPSLLKIISITKPSMLALTMEATFEKARKAIELGAKDLLLKPVTPEKLLKTVKKINRAHISTSTPQLINTARQETIFRNEDFHAREDSPYSEYPLLACKPEDVNHLHLLYSNLLSFPFKTKIEYYIFDEIIVGVVKKGTESIAEECKRFMENWLDEHNIPAFFAIYYSGVRQRKLHELYMEIKEMGKVSFFTGFKQVLEFRQPIDWKIIDPFLNPAEQNSWVTFLQQSNMEEIRSWLYREFLECIHPYPDPDLIRIRLTSILAQVRRYMKTLRVLDQRYEKDYLDLFQRILYSPLIYRIVHELMLFIASLFEAANQEFRRMDIVEECRRFIKKNYRNPELSLSSLSESLRKNPSYLSDIISKRTGRTFSDLVNEERLNSAKTLLEDPDLTIKEVSFLSGFRSQQYFNRLFKKMTKITPTEFRHYVLNTNGSTGRK